MIDEIKDSNFESITFLSLNYHRPPTDSCALSTLNKDEYFYRLPNNRWSQCKIKRSDYTNKLFIPMHCRESVIFR